MYNDLAENNELGLDPKLIYTKLEQEHSEPVMLLACPGEKEIDGFSP